MYAVLGSKMVPQILPRTARLTTLDAGNFFHCAHGRSVDAQLTVKIIPPCEEKLNVGDKMNILHLSLSRAGIAIVMQIWQFINKKSRIRETPTLSTDADSRPNTNL